LETELGLLDSGRSSRSRTRNGWGSVGISSNAPGFATAGAGQSSQSGARIRAARAGEHPRSVADHYDVDIPAHGMRWSFAGRDVIQSDCALIPQRTPPANGNPCRANRAQRRIS
jgi:hypothetical protein